MASDLIGRYALVEELEKVFCDNCDNYNENRCRACLMDDALGYIDAQPTVDAVEVVRGEWERIPYSFAGGYRCSCCGHKTLERHWNYCPDCGADMRGEKNASD